MERAVAQTRGSRAGGGGLPRRSARRPRQRLVKCGQGSSNASRGIGRWRGGSAALAGRLGQRLAPPSRAAGRPGRPASWTPRSWPGSRRACRYEERIENVADDAELEEVYNSERHLLYVACTRAQDRLLVTGVEPASRPWRPGWLHGCVAVPDCTTASRLTAISHAVGELGQRCPCRAVDDALRCWSRGRCGQPDAAGQTIRARVFAAEVPCRRHHGAGAGEGEDPDRPSVDLCPR